MSRPWANPTKPIWLHKKFDPAHFINKIGPDRPNPLDKRANPNPTQPDPLPAPSYGEIKIYMNVLR